MNTDTIKQAIQGLLPEIIALRHELHEHPEIRFEGKWTSDRIARYLAEVVEVQAEASVKAQRDQIAVRVELEIPPR